MIEGERKKFPWHKQPKKFITYKPNLKKIWKALVWFEEGVNIAEKLRSSINIFLDILKCLYYSQLEHLRGMDNFWLQPNYQSQTKKSTPQQD